MPSMVAGGFGFADADDGIGRSAAQQPAADVGGTEAVLEVHGGAKAVDLCARKGAAQHAFQ